MVPVVAVILGVVALLGEWGHEDFTSYVVWTCQRALERGLLHAGRAGFAFVHDRVREALFSAVDSALGSLSGQFLRVTNDERKVLLAAGAAVLGLSLPAASKLTTELEREAARRGCSPARRARGGTGCAHHDRRAGTP